MIQQPTSMYEKQRLIECASYQDYYEGSIDALFCVISSEYASEATRKALIASAERGGFSEQSIIWITTNRDSVTQEEQLLAPGLQQIVESVDPLCMVVLDQHAAAMVSRAYNRPIHLECTDFVLGRPCCCFTDFDRMLQTEENKQLAWALLKDMLSYANDI